MDESVTRKTEALESGADRKQQPDISKLEPYIEEARELFARSPQNPILQVKDMPVPCKAVCNPGACVIDDEVLLLLRVIDDQDHSHLHVARSANGVTDWRIEKAPLLSPKIEAGWYDDWGCEDPRITYLADRQEYVITYVGVSRFGAGVCLATTRDFKTVTRLGIVIHPYNKDAVLLPRKVGGKYLLLHRPTAGPLEDIWISESDDLLHWGNPRSVIEESDQPGWNSGKVGAGPPPIETARGWFQIFHGVRPIDGVGWEYRFGLALLDKDDPSRVLRQWPEWVFGPQEPYEYAPNKEGIVFPTGLVVKDGKLMVYYGAGDTSVALAMAEADVLNSFRDAITRGVQAKQDHQRGG